LTLGSLIVAGGGNIATGALTGNSTAVQTAGNTKLLITGNYLITGAPAVTIDGGNGTSTSQGTLSLVDSQINTLFINSTATTANRFDDGS